MQRKPRRLKTTRPTPRECHLHHARKTYPRLESFTLQDGLRPFDPDPSFEMFADQTKLAVHPKEES